MWSQEDKHVEKKHNGEPERKWGSCCYSRDNSCWEVRDHGKIQQMNRRGLALTEGRARVFLQYRKQGETMKGTFQEGNSGSWGMCCLARVPSRSSSWLWRCAATATRADVSTCVLVVGRRYRSTDGPPQIPYRNFKVISTTASKLTSSPILPLCPTKYFDPNLGIPLSESSLSFVNPSVKWSKSALPGRYPLLTSCPLYLLIEHISNADAAAIECYSRHASLRSGTADEPGVRVSSMIIVSEDKTSHVAESCDSDLRCQCRLSKRIGNRTELKRVKVFTWQ